MQSQAREALITAQAAPLELIKCTESLEPSIDFRSRTLVINTKREIFRKDSPYSPMDISPPWFIQILVTGGSEDRFLCSSTKPGQRPVLQQKFLINIAPKYPLGLRPKLVKYLKWQFSSQKCNSEEEGKNGGEKKKGEKRNQKTSLRILNL